ncbi:MAG: hypothetical protein JO142_10700 [Burkholderiales bacterium]|nr:hypothetical protein [Burkholderiales bacterium]
MGDKQQRQYDALVTAIHGVVLEPSKWENILKRVSEAVGADCGTYYLCDKRTDAAGVWYCSDRSNLALTVYPERFGAVDPWSVAGAHALVGEWHSEAAYFSPHHVKGAALSLVPPAEHPHRAVVASRAFEDGSSYAVVGFIRNNTHKAFGTDEIGFLDRLSPHLELACRLSSEFSRLRLQAAIAHQALDRLATPLWVVDQDSHVLFFNHAAEVDGNGIGVRHERLVVDGSGHASRLTQLIASATANPPRSGALALEHGDALRTTLLVAPLPPDSPLAANWRGPLALVMAHSPTSSESRPLEILTALYGLSPAECRLAGLLLEGYTPSESAERLDVQVSTVRTQLKSIFWKTGTHRQGELLKLLSGALLLKV